MDSASGPISCAAGQLNHCFSGDIYTCEPKRAPRITSWASMSRHGNLVEMQILTHLSWAGWEKLVVLIYRTDFAKQKSPMPGLYYRPVNREPVIEISGGKVPESCSGQLIETGDLRCFSKGKSPLSG